MDSPAITGYEVFEKEMNALARLQFTADFFPEMEKALIEFVGKDGEIKVDRERRTFCISDMITIKSHIPMFSFDSNAWFVGTPYFSKGRRYEYDCLIAMIKTYASGYTSPECFSRFPELKHFEVVEMMKIKLEWKRLSQATTSQNRMKIENDQSRIVDEEQVGNNKSTNLCDI